MMDLWLFSETKLRTKLDTISALVIYPNSTRQPELVLSLLHVTITAKSSILTSLIENI